MGERGRWEGEMEKIEHMVTDFMISRGKKKESTMLLLPIDQDC